MREEQIQEVVKARRQIADGQLTIFSVRLETLQRAGNISALLQAIASPLDPAPNANCGGCNPNTNCPCPPPSAGEEVMGAR
jgi:hypothetical protein